MSTTFSFKCPNCGGDLRFDPNSGKYTCQYCKSVFSQEELDRLEAAAKAKMQGSANEEEQAAKEAAAAAAAGDTSDAQAVVYNCPSCGAQIVTDATTAATFCYYCHNPVVLAGRLEGAYSPDYVIPFKIDRKKAVETFKNWVAQKKFVPTSFYNQDQIDKMTGVYFPYLLYSCKIGGHIDAKATRTEITQSGDIEYTTRGTYHVKREGNMEVKHVTRNALSKANKILVEGVQPFNFSELQPFKMSYLSGFQAEKRDMGKEQFENGVVQEVHDYAVQQLKNSVAGYDDLQITDDAIELEEPAWNYALLPVWTVTYKDPSSGKIYYFSENGETGKVIGELPVDNKKLLLLFLSIFIPIFILLLLAGYFFL